MIGDPHQHVKLVRRIINFEQSDYVVVLGDWFDSHVYFSKQDALDTAIFVKHFLFTENCFSLIGNHDLPYLYANPSTICSGYSKTTNDTVNEVFGKDFQQIREKFKWFLWIDDWFVSHGGLHTNHFPPIWKTVNKQTVTEFLNDQIKQAEITLINNGTHWLYRSGKARGGTQPIGGLTWLDFRKEFVPIEEFRQIVGHTYMGQTVKTHVENGSLDIHDCDLCIDTQLCEYLIITSGKIEVKKSIDIY